MRHLATAAVGTVALLLSAPPRPPARPSISPRPPACDPGDGDITLPDPTLTEDELALQRLLGPQPRAVDDMIAESGIPAARVSAALMLLELKGLARKVTGTSYVRVFGRVARAR